MYHLLVVDDEEMIRRMIVKYANFEGHTVTEAADGMTAVELVKHGQFDILIIDIMMPELDGFSACREIRKFSDIPIIMLSARGEEYDKINGFGLGVDDYVVKPFSPKEYDLFFYMLKNKNIALSRERLLSEVWGYDYFGDDRTLDTHIKLLRKSLGPYASLIVTLRGMGYRFDTSKEI